MTIPAPAHGPARLAGAPARPVHLSRSDRLRLTLALCCALTGTPWGLTMAVVVLGVLAARHSARRTVDRSAAVRRRVLAPPQDAHPLHAAGRPSEALARP